MKKILTIAAVLVMILALSLSAFAAELSYSVSYGDQTVSVNGGSVTISSADKNVVAANENALLDTIERAGIAADAKVVILDFKASPDVTFPAVVTFAVDNISDLAAIFHWNGTAWETISFTKNADGTVSATFNSLSPVALVYGSAAAPAVSAPSTAPAGPQRSPQTGYNTVLWIIMAAAMVSLAGYCFVSARKKTQE